MHLFVSCLHAERCCIRVYGSIVAPNNMRTCPVEIEGIRPRTYCDESHKHKVSEACLLKQYELTPDYVVSTVCCLQSNDMCARQPKRMFYPQIYELNAPPKRSVIFLRVLPFCGENAPDLLHPRFPLLLTRASFGRGTLFGSARENIRKVVLRLFDTRTLDLTWELR